jgi:hypothetical protein
MSICITTSCVHAVTMLTEHGPQIFEALFQALKGSAFPLRKFCEKDRLRDERIVR